MKLFFYDLFTRLSKRTGLWIFKVFTWFVASGYFFLFPGRLSNSIGFYRALFPHRNFLYHALCSWRQYHSFTTVYLDRFIMQDFGDIDCTREGWEHISKAVEERTGAILLMSHMGSWEIAAHLLKLKGMKLLLYLGEDYKEQLEKKQKTSLESLGVRIIAVGKDAGSPFEIVEGINFLREGGLVSLTGDRLWQAEQRAVAVRFLGHRVFLPETPHIFALLSGAPLIFFFVSRTGEKTYHMTVSEPRYVKAASRRERDAAVRASAQAYADLLEIHARRRPHEWYHFEPFLGEKLEE